LGRDVDYHGIYSISTEWERLFSQLLTKYSFLHVQILFAVFINKVSTLHCTIDTQWYKLWRKTTSVAVISSGHMRGQCTGAVVFLANHTYQIKMK